MIVIVLSLGALLGLIYYQRAIGAAGCRAAPQLQLVFFKVFAALLLLSGIVAWWLVLTSESRRVAQEESNRQTGLLTREIELHQPDRRPAAAGQAGRRPGESGQEPLHRRHQPRNPHAAQLHPRLRAAAGQRSGDSSAPPASRARDPQQRRAPAVADRRHAGYRPHRKRQTALRHEELDFPDFIGQVVRMFRTAGGQQGLSFRYELTGSLPQCVRADRKRLGQI
jgi:hypothetical protein